MSSKFLIKYNGQMVPVSSLDRVLKKTDTTINLDFYNFITGKQVTTENRMKFYESVTQKCSRKTL